MEAGGGEGCRRAQLFFYNASTGAIHLTNGASNHNPELAGWCAGDCPAQATTTTYVPKAQHPCFAVHADAGPDSGSSTLNCRGGGPKDGVALDAPRR